MRILLYLFILIHSLSILYSQDIDSTSMRNTISSIVGSVKLQKSTNELSVPTLNFQSREKLLLRFDLFDSESKDLAYEIILCDKDWVPTKLDRYDYIEGFESIYIRDFEHSINTLVNYMNYKTEIPTDDFSFKMSGNYIVRVFEEGSPEITILQRRFILAESEMKVEANVVQPQVVLDSRYKQQVNFNITYPDEISDPLTNLYVTIRQNRNWVTSLTNLQADYVKGNKLFFNDQTKFTFDGNDEFRQIDLKFNRSGNLEVGRIVRENDQYQVYLKEDKPKAFDTYVFKEDLNGKFTIKNDEANDIDIESDYFNVHFELGSNYVIDGDVYVFGEISNWEILEEFKLTYNQEKRKYTLNKYIKQGMINFCYLIHNSKTNYINIEKIEGNHFETENDYDIILYYRDIRQENDRVLGVYSFNSLY